MKKQYQNFVKAVSTLKDFPLLFMRLVLAYGFYVPAKNKWSDISAIADWFGSMNYPFPTLNAYLAAGAEAAGVILLALGLLTRFISIPLIIVMLVAIFTVHAGNGFNAGDNGYEIPLYYLIMLLTLTIYGPGKLSVDFFVSKAERK